MLPVELPKIDKLNLLEILLMKCKNGKILQLMEKNVQEKQIP